MICPKCKSENVTVQVINQVKIKKGHGIVWWLCIGFWWVPMKWLCFTLPALLFAVFGKKKQRAVNKQITKCICQNCGNTWNK